MTLDKRLWKLFLEMVSIVTVVFNIDCDDLLKKATSDTIIESRFHPFFYVSCERIFIFSPKYPVYRRQS